MCDSVLCCTCNAGGLAMDTYTEIMAMYERHYPEMLSVTYIINGTVTASLIVLVLL